MKTKSHCACREICDWGQAHSNAALIKTLCKAEVEYVFIGTLNFSWAIQTIITPGIFWAFGELGGLRDEMIGLSDPKASYERESCGKTGYAVDSW